jgi:imidazolonepropionase-like amidohydrolase
VIKSTTSLAAEHMGVAADVGALEVGRYGDLVAVRGNPLEDIAVLQNLSVVVKGGAIVNRQSAQATTDAHTE